MQHSSSTVLQNSFLMGKKKVDIHFNIRCFQIPKSSKTFIECEDAFFIDNPNEPKFIAVADGCGSTFAPKFMAQNLTQSFPKYAKEIFKKDLKNWHHNAIENWTEQTKSFGYDKIPSFLRTALKDKYGASTFLGVQIHNKSFMSDISVINVGDTALFHLNSKKRIKRMIPQIEQFTGATAAISSREKGFNFTIRQLKLHYLDTIILATDGVGDWIFEHKDELETLLKIKNNGEFLDFVNAIRQEKPSLDDDSTVVIIEAVKILHKQKGYVPSEEWMKEYDKLRNERLLEELPSPKTPELEETIEEKPFEKVTETEELIEEQFDEKGFKKRFLKVLETSKEKKDQNLILAMISKFSFEELNHFISILKPLFYGNESTKSGR